MKSKRYIILLLTLLLFSSCAAQEGDKDTEPKVLNDNAEVLVSRSKDYEMVFESVETVDGVNLVRLEETGIIKGILSNGEILLAEGPELSLYNIDANEKTLLADDAYNTTLSKDESFLVYENDAGIHLMELDRGESRLLYPMEDEIFRNLFISQDNKHIFVQTIKGEDFVNFSLDTEGNIKDHNIIENKSFQINHLISYNENYLIGIAQMSESSDQELMNWSTNLVRISLRDNSIRNLTDLDADDQVFPLGDYIEGEELIKIVKNRMNKEEEIERTIEIRRLNTSGGYLSGRIAIEDTIALEVIDRRSFIYLSEPEEHDYNFPDTMNIILEENEKTNIIGSIKTGIPTELFVDEDKLIFNSNEDIYCIEF